MLLGSANRDPASYPDPHGFDPDCPNIQPVSFGGGAHYVSVASLARLEAQVAFPLLLTMVPRLSLAGPGERRDRLVLRGYGTLPVTTGWHRRTVSPAAVVSGVRPGAAGRPATVRAVR